jgi:hypothetical protein
VLRGRRRRGRQHADGEAQQRGVGSVLASARTCQPQERRGAARRQNTHPSLEAGGGGRNKGRVPPGRRGSGPDDALRLLGMQREGGREGEGGR